MSYLEKISSPDDIKNLSFEQLKELCGEIRQFLISAISKTGGHLASNLGVVELTVALHYCYSCPKDKIIWDVGHQAYTHKILTGRRNMFDSLRKKDGLSGFPKAEESRFDVFNTGHSSTSISAALGFAAARDLSGDSYNIAAVIGDGSMTGGLVYEAMNNAGRNNTKLLIVLNDNQMSISKNVGSMSKYLSELRAEPKYLETKNDIHNFLEHVPMVGSAFEKVLEKTKEGLKYALVPNVMFEQLGIKYIGPIDGHDIKKLISVINNIKYFNNPVLLHVITKKGKGYKKAEKHPSQYHGVSSFDVSTGRPVKLKKSITYSDVFGKTMVRIAAKNKKLVAITAAMPQGTGLEFFGKTYPERMFDVGIAEQHAVTFAAGIAKSGYTPVFAVYSTFLQRSYDQILHDVCIQNLHVVFAVDRAGIVGDDGETHQGIYDLSFLSHIPNMTVIAPKNKKEFIDMLYFAIYDIDGPIAVRYPKAAVSELLSEHDSIIEYGKSETVFEGDDIAIISVGAMFDTAYGVYNRLSGDGFSPKLINARFINPIDSDMIRDLKVIRYIFILEDNIYSGGYAGKFMQKMAKQGVFDKKIYSFSFPDTYIEQGSREQLFYKYGLDEEAIYSRIKKIINKEPL